MAAAATISISTLFTYTSTSDLAVFTGTPSITYTGTLSATDITKVYAAVRSVSAADPFNVLDGSLLDTYGAALVFGTVKAVVIKNTSATATLTIGGGSNPLFGTDQYTLKAGQCLPVLSPFTVDGTHKVITVTPSAAATYQIIVAGI